MSPGDRQVEAGTHLRAYSDSAVKQEEQTGHCMRGAVFLLCPGKNDESYVRTAKCHLLDFVSRQQRKVVRATFSAELMGACDTCDKDILLSQMLHEISSGDCSIEGARQRRENGGYQVPLVLYIDAMSVFAAVTASFVKILADNGMLTHVQYLRELLDSRVLTALGWTDTRDMVADGTTKGAVDRQQLHTCMSGTNEIGHEVKLWKAKGKMHSVDLASAVSSAPVDSALVCSTVASAVSLFVTV